MLTQKMLGKIIIIFLESVVFALSRGSSSLVEIPAFMSCTSSSKESDCNVTQ